MVPFPIVQEAIDTLPKLSDVPSKYADRVRRAMKELQPSNNAGPDAANATPKRVIVIGAGASGLSAAKEFAEKGFHPTVFESGPSIGGVFRDAYKGLELTSSNVFTAYSDYPPKEKEATMWTAAQYLSYLHSYCLDNNIFQHIQFNSTVVGIKRIGGLAKSGIFFWEVTTCNSSTGEVSQSIGDHLVVSVGSNASPNIPEFPGKSLFSGTVVHTSQLESGFDIFRVKRVLCLGLGESGSDLREYCQNLLFFNYVCLELHLNQSIVS